MAEPDHARALHKARALLNAGLAVTKASADALKKDLSVAAQQRAMLAAVPEYLKGRLAWGKATVEICQQQAAAAAAAQQPEADKGRLRATAFALKGLPQELYATGVHAAALGRQGARGVRGVVGVSSL